MAVNLFTDDLNRVSNSDLFKAISEFARVQPSEGWRHDYTEAWTDSALKDIAGFANTYGGLLMVGVKKGKRDTVCELVGVESTSEYKTRIASAIAGSISPTPSYEIFECGKPGTSNQRFCIVRVHSDRLLHLITKKSIQPAYVRNEDEARPADAVQLRSLIERENQSRQNPPSATNRAEVLLGSIRIYHDFQSKDPENWFVSACRPSQTRLTLALVPVEALSIELDTSHEEALRDFIAQIYLRIYNLIGEGKANSTESRAAEFFEFTWYHKHLDYQGKWRVTQDGGIAYATEMQDRGEASKPSWSVVDLAQHLILFVKLALRWWKATGYFGESYVSAQLSVPGLPIARAPAGHFTRFFDPMHTYSAQGGQLIAEDALRVSDRPRGEASAQRRLNYFSATEDLDRFVTSLMNQLLRSLGHAVSSRELEHSVRLIARAAENV